ncbi:hypothetical protein Tco_1346875 [Tanacetum coccineum]
MDVELARKMEEEERARFNVEQEARALQEEEEERLNLEAAWELQRQLDERQQVPTEATQSKGIDWNDPNVLRYHALKNKPVVWDHVNTFIPIESEVEKGSSKPSKRETSNTVEEEKVEKEDVKSDPVMSEKKVVGTRRKTLARRRAILKDKEESVTPEFIYVRYPIVNWEYQLLGRMEMKDMEVYKLTRVDGTISFHEERFEDHSLEEKELILWGDLRMIFDLDEQDEIWKNQESWKIKLLVEKNVLHSKKEILEKMINLKLQAEEESTMAFELIKFTRSQIEEKHGGDTGSGDSIRGSGGEGIWGSGDDHGESGNEGGGGIARSLSTSSLVRSDIGVLSLVDILAVTRYAGCSGGDCGRRTCRSLKAQSSQLDRGLT